MSSMENKNWKEFILKEAAEGVSQKRKIRMPKAEAEKFKAQQQAQLQPQQTKESDSSNPFSLGNIATGIGIQYGINKLMSKGGEEAAAEAGKEVAKKAVTNTPKGELVKNVFTNNITKFKDAVTAVRSTAETARTAITATRLGFGATEVPMVPGAIATEYGTGAAVGAVGLAIGIGATIGSAIGYVVNLSYSWFGKGYGEIVQNTLNKAKESPGFIIKELDDYKKGGYKYELGTEENKKDYGFGLSTKGERVKTGILGFGSDVRTPNSWDAKDAPIIIGLLSALYNNEKANGKVLETNEQVDGQEVKIIDISNSALMNYESLINLFGSIDSTTGEFRPNTVMYSKIPQNFHGFILAMSTAYALAKMNKKYDKIEEKFIRKITDKKSIIKESVVDSINSSQTTVKRTVSEFHNKEQTWRKPYEVKGSSQDGIAISFEVLDGTGAFYNITEQNLKEYIKNTSAQNDAANKIICGLQSKDSKKELIQGSLLGGSFAILDSVGLDTRDSIYFIKCNNSKPVSYENLGNKDKRDELITIFLNQKRIKPPFKVKDAVLVNQKKYILSGYHAESYGAYVKYYIVDESGKKFEVNLNDIKPAKQEESTAEKSNVEQNKSKRGDIIKYDGKNYIIAGPTGTPGEYYVVDINGIRYKLVIQ